MFSSHSLIGNRRQNKKTLDYGLLESRNLLAASLVLNGTRLTIEGTSADDYVQVNQTANDIEVQVAGGETANYLTDQLTFIRFNGRSGDDSFVNNSEIVSHAYGQIGNDILSGGRGDDYLRGGLGNDQIFGNEGNDQIYGDADMDVISAGTGDDLVRGSYGRDTIYGEAGDDTIYGGWGNDRVFGGLGHDYILGAIGNDILHGNEGNDQIEGQGGFDRIYGEVGNDSLYGGIDNDYIIGGPDNDFVQAGKGDDVVWGGSGSDTLKGYLGNDEIHGGYGDDSVSGFDGADALFGGEGVDNLRGGDGNDEIHGENGDDVIIGDAGDDEITGGDGNDVIRGNAGDDKIEGQNGNDALYGGVGDDLILGEGGVDQLDGNIGNDVLFAGLNEGVDTLDGGDGLDRFLVRGTHQVGDLTDDDARIIFEDVTSAWTYGEVAVVDAAFEQLFAATNNTTLLKDTLPSGDLTFYKYADLNGAAGINYLEWTTSFEWDGNQWIEIYDYTREIQIADWNENSEFYNNFYQSTVIHELAHNWDDDFELEAVSAQVGLLWNDFLNVGGWTDTDPGSSNYTQSNDGNWWYINSASFADPYGRTNPNEDMATIWEHYFNQGMTGDANLLQKLDIVDQVIQSVTS